MVIHTNTNKLTSCKVTDQTLLSIIGVKTVKTGYKEISNTKKKSCLFLIAFFVMNFREIIVPLPSHTGWKEDGKLESSRQGSVQED